MFFELTEPLINEIIFSMENQDCEFAFDSVKKKVVPSDSVFGIGGVESESIYPLPAWNSEAGFRLLAEFAESVRIPKIRDEIQQVLSNGRGVFKSFKNVVKKYPQIDRRFHSFKERKMRSVIFEWYNALRESWGLEMLSQDFEEYYELTQEDFVFSGYNSQKDRDCIAFEAGVVADEIQKSFPGEAGSAVAHLWLRGFLYEPSEDMDGVVCRTLSDEFAGVLLFSRCPSSAKETVALTACFVNQNYRGLGIARELLSHCISYLKKLGIHWFIIADSALPDYIEPLLTRCGFEKKGSVFLADLAE